MKSSRNKYLGFIILLAIVSAGVLRVHEKLTVPPVEKGLHSAQNKKYKDAVIAHRLHQTHFKRHRFNLDGTLPVQQDTMVPIVTGEYAVAPVQTKAFTIPATPSLRGPPAA